MPADLDELFEALGRSADKLPLAGAAAARSRGRRRTVTRAVVSAAAAVVVVLVGVGYVLRDPHPQAAEPATTPTGSPGLPLLGTVGLGTQHLVTAYTAQDGARAYTAWIKYEDNSQWVIAADLATGRAAWAARPINDPGRAIVQIVSAPSAVLVVTGTSDSSGARGLFAFDPATGTKLWQGVAPAGNSLVFTDRMVVRSSRLDGWVEGLDWRTGAPRWHSDLSQDRPLRTLGMTVAADEARIDRAGPRPDLTDGRIVVVTVAGQVEVRDSATGAVLRRTTVPTGSGDTMVAYEGWLFSHDEADDNGGPQHLRATSLGDKGGTSSLGAVPGRFRTMSGCGSGRICVLTDTDEATGSRTLTALDVKGHQVWQAKTDSDGEQISSARGATMLTSWAGGIELYDRTGKRIFEATLVTGWLDAGTLLIVDPDGTGRWARWSVVTHKTTPLGPPPAGEVGFCASTSSVLACPTPDGLRLWRVV